MGKLEPSNVQTKELESSMKHGLAVVVFSWLAVVGWLM
jgi:hypothetical protein